MSIRLSINTFFLSLIFVGQAANVFGQSKPDTTSYAQVLDLLQRDQYKDAFAILDKLKEQYNTLEPDRKYVQLLLEVAIILNEKGSYEPGLAYCFYILDLSSNHKGFTLEETESLLEIGSAYYFLDLANLSLEYTRRALALARKNGYKEQIAEAVNKEGLYYEKTGNYDLALQKFDSALQMRKEIKDLHAQSATLGNMGLVLEKLHRYDDAMKYQLQSLALDDSIHNILGVAWSHQMLGSLSTKMRSFEQATNYLDKAEESAKQLKSNELLIQIYKDKKVLLERLGKFEDALRYANGYERLVDSVHNKALLGRATLLQSTYELDRKDKEIAAQQVTLNWQRNFILLAVAVTLVVSILAFFYYRSFNEVKKLHDEIAAQHEEIRMQTEELTKANLVLIKLNQETAEQKEEIQAQSEELTESNQTISQINENLEQTVRERTTELVQAYKELDTFFYRASHDFRRPLTTFMGLSEVAKITVKDPYALELFEMVRQTARNLDKMLMKLQSISDVGLQQLSFKEIFPTDIFNTIFATYREDLRNAEIHFKTETTVTSFNSYPAIINVILENLVENAIYFRCSNDAYVKLSICVQGEEIVLAVSDNGQGIQEQYQDQIFDMYFRGNENSKGNGLGLYIVKKATEKLRGHISFTSIYDEGSTFSVFLPKGKS